jgi:small-conductance mechanosensitive channel
MEGFDLTQEFENTVGNIIGFLPNILAALLILLIGGLIASGLARLTRKVLQRMRFDRVIHSSAAGAMVSRVVESPSYFTGRIVFWLIMIGAISLAVAALNLPILNDLLGAIYSYIPNIIAAVIIFLIASAVSAGAARFVMRIMGDTVISRMVSTAVPAITMSLAVFMILNQLRIATDIVNILFTAIVGAVALGLALAFGLGGRDVAKGLLEQAADNARAKQAMDTTESTRRATRR